MRVLKIRKENHFALVSMRQAHQKHNALIEHISCGFVTACCWRQTSSLLYGIRSIQWFFYSVKRPKLFDDLWTEWEAYFGNGRRSSLHFVFCNQLIWYFHPLVAVRWVWTDDRTYVNACKVSSVPNGLLNRGERLIFFYSETICARENRGMNHFRFRSVCYLLSAFRCILSAFICRFDYYFPFILHI